MNWRIYLSDEDCISHFDYLKAVYWIVVIKIRHLICVCKLVDYIRVIYRNVKDDFQFKLHIKDKCY